MGKQASVVPDFFEVYVLATEQGNYRRTLERVKFSNVLDSVDWSVL